MAITLACLARDRGSIPRSFAKLKRDGMNTSKITFLSGKKNPAWRGGHKYWSSGRFGSDKNGLSWKKQRLLAWQRDNYKCSMCRRSKLSMRRNPDVHHIVPWRISFSHDLKNLLSLCQKCHKKEDEKYKNVVGLKNIYHSNKPVAKKYYCLCGKQLKINIKQCRLCSVKKKYNIIKEYKDSGLSLRQIQKETGINFETVRKYFSGEVKILRP